MLAPPSPRNLYISVGMISLGEIINYYLRKLRIHLWKNIVEPEGHG
jgi:hypothetical protein